MAFGLAGLYALKGVGGAVQAGIGLNQMAQGRARAEALERAGVPQMATAQEYFDLYQNASRSKQFEQEKAMNQSVLASNLATLQGAGSRAVIGGANAAQLTAQRGMAAAAEADFARQQDALSALAGAQQQTNYLNFQARSQQYASDLDAAREAFTAGLETAISGAGSAFTGLKGYLENRPEREGLGQRIAGRVRNIGSEKRADALAAANNAASIGASGENVNPNASFFGQDDFGYPTTSVTETFTDTMDMIGDSSKNQALGFDALGATRASSGTSGLLNNLSSMPGRMQPMGSLPTSPIETGVTPQIQTGSGVGVPLDIATGTLPNPGITTTMGGNEVLVPMAYGGFRGLGRPKQSSIFGPFNPRLDDQQVTRDTFPGSVDYSDPMGMGATRATGVSRRQQRRNRRSARRGTYDPLFTVPADPMAGVTMPDLYLAEGGAVTTPGKYTADHSLEYDVKTKGGKTIATLTGDETLVFNPEQRGFLKRIIRRLINGETIKPSKSDTKEANETLKAFKK
tara:strand:+ start:5720 stop:7264 length:1545 start_codon:yes stop_codon:yes gene_type:complete